MNTSPFSPQISDEEKVTSIVFSENTNQLVTIDIEGNELSREPFICPIFRQIFGDQLIIKVKLTKETNADTFIQPVIYNNKSYRIDLIGGSSVKTSYEDNGSSYGIQSECVSQIAGLLSFDESVCYGQRAIFPLVISGVKEKIRVKTVPLTGSGKTFLLKNNMSVQVEDGWGYITQSLADKMAANMPDMRKRGFSEESGRASYQMLQWLDTEDPEVVAELVMDGVNAFNKFVNENPALVQTKVTQDIDKIKKLHSILTTGMPAMELAVAMPVPGDCLIIPDCARFTGKISGRGVAVIRSPADKQNFCPVLANGIEYGGMQSPVSSIEAIQYTLTGKENGERLTFFKGMSGIISDELWPDAWQGIDMIVTAKDRKLYQGWEMDTSLKAGESHPTVYNDRATTYKISQDFIIDGSLVAIQWFEKGSFVGVPYKIQTWLGGDYDGDEVGVIFENKNPELIRAIKRVYRGDELNPKLTKTFTHDPHISDGPRRSRARRLMDMRSSNAGMWSNIAARLKALPEHAYESVAQQTKTDRLLTDDRLSVNLCQGQLMIIEAQQGIKVGTDGCKTNAPTGEFERRARVYIEKLYPFKAILHDKSLNKVISNAIFPTLTHPAWANIFFSYDQVNMENGAYEVSGISPRILQRMVRKLLPPEDLANINGNFTKWYEREGFDITGKLLPNVCYIFNEIDNHNLEESSGTTALLITNIFKGNCPICYAEFETAYFLSAVSYWYESNEWALREFYMNAGWKKGLVALLKRYYMLSS